ncbi:hypothetical protein OIU77_024337 [Salix suchowensis]|uniref:Uncharacterized protein n=1 Tax=Salix suchowensis TaxID=1278906 RepID=A0ABQ9BSD9_9ROSI|nr:hypothetical protein OIU77_024337 [Salix suchowensis]
MLVAGDNEMITGSTNVKPDSEMVSKMIRKVHWEGKYVWLNGEMVDVYDVTDVIEHERCGNAGSKDDAASTWVSLKAMSQRHTNRFTQTVQNIIEIVKEIEAEQQDPSYPLLVQV